MGVSKQHIFQAWLLFSGLVLAIAFILYKLLLSKAAADAAEVPSVKEMLLYVYLMSIVQFVIIGYFVIKNKEKKATPKQLYIFAMIIALLNAVMWSIFKFYT